MKNDNIVAIATALGASGVAVVRISGDSPLSIAEKMFTPSGKTMVKDFTPYMMYPGVIDCGDFSDFGMVVYFKGPKSFTGEDVVEIQCHGGAVIPQGVVRQAVKLGARLAGPGEYTKRAFMNGKLSLSGAEGLIDMINSQSVAGTKAGFYLYREKLNKEVDFLQSRLLDALCEIDADMDFPEEDLELDSHDKVKEIINEVIVGIDKLLATYRVGRVVKNGVRVGIVGKPNTGKSSLLNALIGFDRAIVSDTAGTTRDVVEGTIDYNGVRFYFSDTAGIRESSDKIEEIGVLFSKRILDESDLIMFVIDPNDFDDQDIEIKNLIADKNVLTVLNKLDLNGNLAVSGDLSVSALTGENVNQLKQMVFDKTIGAGIDLNADFLCEERHFNALLCSKDRLLSAKANIDDVTLDVLSIDIKDAWEKLGEISGKTATEEIIDNIFSKFCVGK